MHSSDIPARPKSKRSADVVALPCRTPLQREDHTPMLWQASAKLELAGEIASGAIAELGRFAPPPIAARVAAITAELEQLAQHMLIDAVPQNERDSANDAVSA